MSTLSNATAVLRLFSAERLEVSVSEVARLDDDEVRALHRERLTPPSKNSPRGMRQLLEVLAETRRTGCAVSAAVCQ